MRNQFLLCDFISPLLHATAGGRQRWLLGLCILLGLFGCNPPRATFSSSMLRSVQPQGAHATDLSGVWDGGFRRANDDWGEVRIQTAANGYVGTYSDTYNGQLGTFTIRKTGDRTYEGEWGETDGRRRGVWQWTVSEDGLRIDITYQAVNDPHPTRHQGGKSVLVKRLP